MSAAGLAGRIYHTAVWTGSRMLVFGGANGDGTAVLGDGASYDPVADAWTSIPPEGPAGVRRHTAVWTGSRMIVWGGDNGHFLNGAYGGGRAYDPVAQTWGPAISATGRTDHQAVWTGS